MTDDNLDFIKYIHKRIQKDKEKDLEERREAARKKQYGDPISFDEVHRKRIGSKIICGKIEGIIVKKFITYVDVDYSGTITRHWRPGSIPYSFYQIIRDDYLSGRTAPQISKQYGFTQARIRRLLRGTKKSKTWTEQENTFVLDNFDVMGIKDLAKQFNVTEDNIRARVKSLGVVLSEGYLWQEPDIKNLIKLRLKGYTAKQMSDELNIDVHRIRAKLNRLIIRGIVPKVLPERWTEKEIAKLIRLRREKNTAQQIADIMNLPIRRVKSKIHKLRLQGRIISFHKWNRMKKK